MRGSSAVGVLYTALNVVTLVYGKATSIRPVYCDTELPLSKLIHGTQELSLDNDGQLTYRGSFVPQAYIAGCLQPLSNSKLNQSWFNTPKGTRVGCAISVSISNEIHMDGVFCEYSPEF